MAQAEYVRWDLQTKSTPADTVFDVLADRIQRMGVQVEHGVEENGVTVVPQSETDLTPKYPDWRSESALDRRHLWASSRAPLKNGEHDAEVPQNYKDRMTALAQATLGGKHIRSFNNPSRFSEWALDVTTNPENLSRTVFQFGVGGNTEVAPRLSAYLVPLMNMAQQFNDQNINISDDVNEHAFYGAMPRFRMFSGHEMAISANWNNDPVKAHQLNTVAALNYEMCLQFNERFGARNNDDRPVLNLEYEGTTPWTDDYIAKLDGIAETLYHESENDLKLMGALYRLAGSSLSHGSTIESTSNGHLSAEDEQHRRNVGRYVAEHVPLFHRSPITEVEEILNQDELYTFNIACRMEQQFRTLTNGILRAYPGGEYDGTLVSDLWLKDIFKASTPGYYCMEAVEVASNEYYVDVPMGNGRWQSFYGPMSEDSEEGRELLHKFFTVPEGLEAVTRSQVVSALTDFEIIGRFIAPTANPKQFPVEGVQAYLKFLADFERQYEAALGW